MTINISNPVNKNISIIAGIDFGNFLSFHLKIRLPMIPLITVEMAHGSAVGPPSVYLYAPEIIPTGIPTTGPPNKPLIITTIHLMLAGTPLTVVMAYDAKSPQDINMTRLIIWFFLVNFPCIISLNGFRFVASMTKIKTSHNVRNISKNGP